VPDLTIPAELYHSAGIVSESYEIIMFIYILTPSVKTIPAVNQAGIKDRY